MSDIHGCKREFDKMLELIDYNSEYDVLWIIGDICDRGNENIPLLQKIMGDESMHIIFGNHDVWFHKYIKTLIDAKIDDNTFDMDDDLLCWLHYNGGYKTADQFMDLPFPQCYDIERYLDLNERYYQELDIHGKKYLLVHAGISDEYYRPNVRITEVPKEILIWAHIGLDDNPFSDKTMIVGHTPTFLYGEEYANKIAKGNNIYHIDGGCVFGYSLACLRLDDLQEFYVKKDS